jgi:hypothetical protein
MLDREVGLGGRRAGRSLRSGSVMQASCGATPGGPERELAARTTAPRSQAAPSHSNPFHSTAVSTVAAVSGVAASIAREHLGAELALVLAP